MTGRRVPSRARRWAGRLLAATLLAAGCVLLGGLPASAHAGVQSTSPFAGSELTVPARSVSLRFDEAVGLSPGSIRVLDATGRQVQVGPAFHPDGDLDAIAVALRPDLARSSFLVVWHVVSADSHPAAGSFSFGYGVPAGPVSPPPPGDPVVGLLDGVLRFACLAGTVLLVGATFFVCVLWRDGLRSARLRRLLVGAWGTVVAGTAALLLVEGPYGSSQPLSGLTDPALVSLTVQTVYGKLLLVRLVGLGLAAVAWRQLRRSWAAPGWLDAVGLGLLVVESYSFAGHAGQGTSVPLAATADAAHLAAAGVWLGGLVVLAVLLRPAAEHPAQLGVQAAVLPRWSKVAAVAVAVLVVTGGYQAWREIGSWQALAGTAYGRLVLAKAAALVVILAVANQARLRVHRHAGGDGAAAPAPGTPGAAGTAGRAGVATGRGLRRAVAVEAALGVAVLAVTTVLVTTMPARESYSPSFSTTVTARDAAGQALVIDIEVSPTRSGFESVTLGLHDAAGRPVRPLAVSGSLRQPALGLGPIGFAATDLADGVARARAVTVPGPGLWDLTLDVRTGPSGDVTARTSYLVNG